MITECEKCGTNMEAKLDTETNKIICQGCDQEIENMSEFAKAMMRQSGDVIKHDANNVPEGGMLVECKVCNKTIVALLEKKDETCYCPHCKNKVNLSAFAIALLKENGQYVGFVKVSVNPNPKTLGGATMTALPSDTGEEYEEPQPRVASQKSVSINEFGKAVEINDDKEELSQGPYQLLVERNKALEAELQSIKNQIKESQNKSSEKEVKSASVEELIKAEVAKQIKIIKIGTAEKPVSQQKIKETRDKIVNKEPINTTKK